jgi:hypothetical protein
VKHPDTIWFCPGCNYVGQKPRHFNTCRAGMPAEYQLKKPRPTLHLVKAEPEDEAA